MQVYLFAVIPGAPPGPLNGRALRLPAWSLQSRRAFSGHLAVDEALPSVRQRPSQACPFSLKVRDALCGGRHCRGCAIVAVRGGWKWKYELAVRHFVDAVFPNQQRDTSFVGTVILGTRR